MNSEAFLVYVPSSDTPRKLQWFAHEDALCEELGHDYSGGNDYGPEDRAIDGTGRVYRIIYNPVHYYQLERTEDTWTAERILSLALEGAKAVKRAPSAQQRLVQSTPDAEKIGVIMEYVRTLPDGTPFHTVVGWSIIAALLIFGLAVTYGVYRFAMWLLG